MWEAGEFVECVGIQYFLPFKYKFAAVSQFPSVMDSAAPMEVA